LTGKAEFSAKLHKVPLNEYFPEYTGGMDADKGAEYILSRFQELYGRCPKTGHLYPLYFADSFDISIIRQFMTTVADIRIQLRLRISGLL